jgi:protein-S-isoprenylcysteine O-methyltransferase Ste14
VPSLPSILHALPLIVFAWMVIGAVIVFTPQVGTRRDPRGIGVGLSIWGTMATTRVAITPPLWMAAIGVAGLMLSLILYHWAAFSIRGSVFSYAGNDDLPQFVHSSGPYAYLRNPFYASYLLAEISTVAIWPSVLGAVIVLLSIGYFQWLARFEEGKFANSPVAADYERYKARTGRLWPRLRR